MDAAKTLQPMFRKNCDKTGITSKSNNYFDEYLKFVKSRSTIFKDWAPIDAAKVVANTLSKYGAYDD
eukprot:9131291-Karenia_brevis.AAC.1